MAPGVLDGPNWQFTTGVAFWHRGNAVSASGQQVTGTTGMAVFGPPPGTCSYDPPPFDVTSKDGVQVPAFAAFPMTILP